jgi:hypothetical protein
VFLTELQLFEENLSQLYHGVYIDLLDATEIGGLLRPEQVDQYVFHLFLQQWQNCSLSKRIPFLDS